MDLCFMSYFNFYVVRIKLSYVASLQKTITYHSKKYNLQYLFFISFVNIVCLLLIKSNKFDCNFVI